MLSKIKLAIGYWIRWVLFFQLARLVFTIYSWKETMQTGIGEVSKSFLYGIRMDISISSYILIPFCFLVIWGTYFNAKNITIWLSIYTAVLLIPISIIVLCDLPAFQAWGYRLDASPLKYLQSPTEAWASVSHLPVIWFFVLWILSLMALIQLFVYYLKAHKEAIAHEKTNLKQTLLILLFTGLQIIPIRGGFQLAPLNQSSVYFSGNNFANLAAINVTWNFLHSLSHHLNDSTNPFNYLTKKEADKISDSLYFSNSKTIQLIDSSKKPNIIIIVWESLTKKAIDEYKNGIEITPGFNKLKKEGIYFSDIYATGDRTDKGIVGVLSGYPSQPTTSIIKIPQKANKLPKLPQVFLHNDYHTSFYYGGELEFANMKSYLLGCGFKSFVSKNDFDSRDQNSKWGAHDGVVKDKLLQDLHKTPAPFFTTWLTLSSHEPYETPVNTVINGNDDESMFLNSIHYSDSVITRFIDEYKKNPEWSNTVVIIVADHGHRLPRKNKKLEDFKIPMLWLGGALLKNNVVVSKTGSQIDISATLLSQLKIPSEDFIWSKNLLNNESKQWSYFSFNNGFGFVQPKKYLIFDNVGKTLIEQNGSIEINDINAAKALQQKTFEDYLLK